MKRVGNRESNVSFFEEIGAIYLWYIYSISAKFRKLGDKI